MNIMSIYGGSGATGLPVPGFVGSSAWRVRRFHGAKSVHSTLLVTDVPANKPLYVSALERCP
jgi:hypothetical protein